MHSHHINTLNKYTEWIGHLREEMEFSVKKIPFSQSREWEKGSSQSCWQHKNGGFFTVEGVLAESRDGRGERHLQPIINQPEVGILGFLFRWYRGDWEILVQAKAEPGNVGLIQLAPTVQATESNYKCRHGGRPTAYLEYFRDPDSARSSTINSSQSRATFSGRREIGIWWSKSKEMCPSMTPFSSGSHRRRSSPYFRETTVLTPIAGRFSPGFFFISARLSLYENQRASRSNWPNLFPWRVARLLRPFGSGWIGKRPRLLLSPT